MSVFTEEGTLIQTNESIGIALVNEKFQYMELFTGSIIFFT